MGVHGQHRGCTSKEERERDEQRERGRERERRARETKRLTFETLVPSNSYLLLPFLRYNVVVMENLFYCRDIHSLQCFDLKGKTNRRLGAKRPHAAPASQGGVGGSKGVLESGAAAASRVSSDEESSKGGEGGGGGAGGEGGEGGEGGQVGKGSAADTAEHGNDASLPLDTTREISQLVGDDGEESDDDQVDVQLDGDLLFVTGGLPVPLSSEAKDELSAAVGNDSLFLSIIEVVDYSIIVGIDSTTNEIVAGKWLV